MVFSVFRLVFIIPIPLWPAVVAPLSLKGAVFTLRLHPNEALQTLHVRIIKIADPEMTPCRRILLIFLSSVTFNYL